VRNIEPALLVGGKLFAGLLALTSYGVAQSTSPTPTPHYATLYSFGSHPHDALSLQENVTVGSGGELYGASYSGGASEDVGTVFALTPPASPGGSWIETVLYRFTGPDGSYPLGTIAVGSGGVLYSTTYTGGTFVGTVFSLTPPASPGAPWTESLLHSFTGGGDGTNPQGALAIGAGGVLYGATASGGPPCLESADGCGTVFSLTPPASPGGSWTEDVLLTFNGVTDGFRPTTGVVIGSGGVLYGTAGETVFSLTPPASPGGPWTEAVLYTFTGSPDGDGPNGVVIGSGGVLYGVTESGGPRDKGTVFSLTPPASAGAPWTKTLLHTFGASGGNRPMGPVAFASNTGVLYGAAYEGGTYGGGVLFAIAPPASPGASWIYTQLRNFGGGTDGKLPIAGVVIGNGALYGTTISGGTHDDGTVFSVTP